MLFRHEECDRFWQHSRAPGDRQVRKSLKSRNKKEDRRRALLIEKELLVGEHKHAQRSPSIGETMDVYLAHLEAEGRSTKTLGKYRFCFLLLLELAEELGVTRLDQLGVAFVDIFRKKRRQADFQQTTKKAKAKTIHNDTVTIRQLILFALKRGLIAEDPLKNLSMRKPKRT